MIFHEVIKRMTKFSLLLIYSLLIVNFACCYRYVSPDYASTGMLNEGSDVYSFGILLMELVTGRSPVDYSRPPGEVSEVLTLFELPLAQYGACLTQLWKSRSYF